MSVLSKSQKLARALDQVMKGRRIFNMQLAAQVKHELISMDTLEGTIAKGARRHAVELDQFAIFASDVDENIAKAMKEAADFLRRLDGDTQ